MIDEYYFRIPKIMNYYLSVYNNHCRLLSALPEPLTMETMSQVDDQKESKYDKLISPSQGELSEDNPGTSTPNRGNDQKNGKKKAKDKDDGSNNNSSQKWWWHPFGVLPRTPSRGELSEDSFGPR